MEEKKNGPISKKRIGRFQISIWKRRKIVPGDNSGFQPEREYDVVRACIQYSRYNNLHREFDRQKIWCDPIELRDLSQVLDELGDDDGGDEQ